MLHCPRPCPQSFPEGRRPRRVSHRGGAVSLWRPLLELMLPWLGSSSLDKYVHGLKEMVDVVGIEHVCIGTDQQVRPASLQDYSQWAHLVAATLRGGFTPKRPERSRETITCASFVLRSVDLRL